WSTMDTELPPRASSSLARGIATRAVLRHEPGVRQTAAWIPC
ncbi:MAG: hypothetical protein AVDCRST_MAG25-416, partial [uncultured Rubrobacteraceae bacterium]